MSHLEVLKKPVVFSNGVSAPNATLKSAMTERLCTWSDDDFKKRGWPTPEYIQLYKTWGEGEIGTIILGNIPCDARYPEAKKNACIDPEIASHDDYVKAYKPVIDVAKAHGSLVIAQVTHAGRQTSEDIAPTPVSSSDVQCPPGMGMTFGKPRPLTVDEIHDTVRRFGFAAKVLYDAKCDGVELHAAHGYLLSQFLSPRVNKRTDQYGGDLDGRSRIVFEIIESIRKAVPDPKFIISIKINSADFADGGFDPEESFTMSKRLEAAGVDLIELSGGTYESSGFEHKTQSNIARGACLPSTHGRTAARQVKCSRRQRRMNGKAAYRPSRGGAPSQTCSMEYDVGKRESIKLRGGERTFDRSPWNSELDGP